MSLFLRMIKKDKGGWGEGRPRHALGRRGSREKGLCGPSSGLCGGRPGFFSE
jgi:hypothetical protein